MRKLLVLATMLMLAAPISAADAAKKPKIKTVKSSGTILANTYVSSGADGVAHYAGMVTDSVFGKGALIFDFKAASDANVTGPFTVFAPTGTLAGTATYKITPATDGSGKLTLAGGLTLTKGTGAYKGLKSGTGKVTGTQDPNTNGDASIKYSLSYKIKK
jgi:hypothetical protein